MVNCNLYVCPSVINAIFKHTNFLNAYAYGVVAAAADAVILQLNDNYLAEDNKFANNRWMLLILPVAIVTGGAVALFLWLMEVVNRLRWNNMWLIFALPLAGVLIAWMYKLAGSRVEAGNDLVIDEIHKPGA